MATSVNNSHDGTERGQVQIWHDGTTTTLSAAEFLRAWGDLTLPPGALARTDPAAPFSLPADSVDWAYAAVTESESRTPRVEPPKVARSEGPRVEPCAACRGTVSIDAIACPHCGHPIRAHVIEPKPARGSAGNVVAAIASLIVPGLGQLAQGRALMAGIAFFAAVALWVVFLGWLIHLAAAWDAAIWNPDAEES